PSLPSDKQAMPNYVASQILQSVSEGELTFDGIKQAGNIALLESWGERPRHVSLHHDAVIVVDALSAIDARPIPFAVVGIFRGAFKPVDGDHRLISTQLNVVLQ